jgi:peptide/nickel transport system substrate-binding protein
MSNRLMHKSVTLVAAFGLLLAASVTGASASSAASQGHTLVVLTPEVAQGINPDGPTASDAATLEALDNLYSTLITYKPQAVKNGVVIPNYQSFTSGLATSWSVKGNVYTFHLRPGVKSCAGNTLNAADVIYTFQRAMSIAGANAVTWFLGNVGGFLPTAPVLPKATAADKKLNGEVTAVNNLTVRFKLQHPDALFPMVLAIGYLNIWDAKAMRSHATASDPWSENFTNSVGAAGFGPYCLSQWTPGVSITYSANPGYFTHPYYTTVVDKAIPEDANRIAAVESGSAQMVTGLDPQEFASIAKSGRASVLGWTANQNVVLEMNYDIAPWNLPKNSLIRQAVADAIPYSEIVNSIYHGNAKQMFSPVPPDYTGYKAVPNYSYNLAKAKRLLAQAGFPGGTGLSKYASGLQLSYPAESASTLQPMATIIQTSLAKIGMHVTLNPISAAQFATDVLTKRDLPFGLDNNEHPIGTDAEYVAQLYFVTAAKGGINNMTNYSSPTVDSLWAKAIAIPNGTARNSVLAKLQGTLMTDLPWIPLVVQTSQIAVAKGITNWIAKPDTTLNYAGFRG